MRLLLNVFLSLTLIALLCVAISGCDGEGFIIDSNKAIDGDDIPDDNDDDVDPIPDDVKELGTWITSYADDDVQASAYGPQQYAAVVKLQRENSELIGTGTVHCIAESGSSAPQKLSIKLSGNVSGDNATLSVISASGGNPTDMPTWRLRFAGNYMIGAYRSVNSSNQQVRNGHALWRKVTTGDLNGSWVAAHSDDSGTAALPARDRTDVMVITHDKTAQTITGSGSLVEQRPGDVVNELAFNLGRTTFSSPSVSFSMTDLDLAGNEIDWFAMCSHGVIVGAYAQYDLADRQQRSGHGTWYLAGDTAPASFNATWATAFSDAGYASGARPSAYLFSMKLTAAEGNILTGSGSMINVLEGLENSRLVKIESASIVGSRLKLDMKIPATGDMFYWEMRLAGNVMVGSYQRKDTLGQYVSSGTAEWRKEKSAPNTAGTWAASFFDTLRPDASELTQFVMVNVANQNVDGSLTGNGALRYMNGETGRRLFSLATSSIDDRVVTWVWRGTDLFGDTTWKMRQAGDFLYGIFENQTASGNLEAIGSAVWVRTSTSTTF